MGLILLIVLLVLLLGTVPAYPYSRVGATDLSVGSVSSFSLLLY